MTKYLTTALRYTLPEPAVSWLRDQAYKRQLLRQEEQLAQTVNATKPSPNGRPNTRYKVAVIGAGGMGQDQCMGLQTMSQVEIVGVADRDPKAIERLFRQANLTS